MPRMLALVCNDGDRWQVRALDDSTKTGGDFLRVEGVVVVVRWLLALLRDARRGYDR